MVQHWRHGWIPLTPLAKRIKAKKARGSTKGKGRGRSDGKGANGKGIGLRSKRSGLEGKDARSMTPMEKIAAAARMYGSGSPQHRAAIKRFRGR